MTVTILINKRTNSIQAYTSFFLWKIRKYKELIFFKIGLGSKVTYRTFLVKIYLQRNEQCESGKQNFAPIDYEKMFGTLWENLIN